MAGPMPDAMQATMSTRLADLVYAGDPA